MSGKIMELKFPGICTSTHCVLYIPTKFLKVPCSHLRGAVRTNYSLLYSLYGQNFKFKRAKIPKK